MKRVVFVAMMLIAPILSLESAFADPVTFTAKLSSEAQGQQNASPGTGSATVVMEQRRIRCKFQCLLPDCRVRLPQRTFTASARNLPALKLQMRPPRSRRFPDSHWVSRAAHTVRVFSRPPAEQRQAQKQRCSPACWPAKRT